MKHSMAKPDTLTGAEVAGHSERKAELARHAQRRGRSRLVLFILAVMAILLARPAAHHVRATSLLLTFSDTKAKSTAVEELLTIDVPASAAGPARTVKARMFSPPGGSPKDHPAVVLVHGVQYRGIEEPRLQHFAQSVVSAGLVVLTPQVDELADYQVSPSSIETVGAAIEVLRARRFSDRVGVMGTSFGGGIALLTAADERFAEHVGFVVAIGAHDDLGRVSRFFATDEIPDVAGVTQKLHAHGYGAMVLVYTHVEDFFPAEDVPAARESLRSWLSEKRDQAREAAKALSPSSKARMDQFFDSEASTFRPALLAAIERRAGDMKKVSPHDHLAGLRAHVYLLHGAGDTVIPASETMWLAHDVPGGTLREALVSPAIEHVELKSPSFGDQAALVHFMGEVIGEAEATR